MEREGFLLRGNVLSHTDGREYLPLYEAKLFHQYDHRFATFEGASKDDLKAGNAHNMTDEEKSNPVAVAIPRYWVPAEEVAKRLDIGEEESMMDSTLDARRSTLDARRFGRPGAQIALRKITRATDERTGIFSMIPLLGLSDSTATIKPGSSLSGILPEPQTNGPQSSRPFRRPR